MPDTLQIVKATLWQKCRPYAIAGAVILLAAAGIYYAYNRISNAESIAEQATVLSQQQAKDANILQNMLNESKQNAQMMADFIKNAQAGHLQPVTNFTVTATSPQAAAQQVADRINQNDLTLPPAALEKTDRTIVSSVATTPEQKAAIDQQNAKNGTNINNQYLTQVYKSNNYRNWDVSAGVGWHNGDVYIPVEVQRNYSKSHAVSGEIHVKPSGSIDGGEAKYTVKTDKIFGLF